MIRIRKFVLGSCGVWHLVFVFVLTTAQGKIHLVLDSAYGIDIQTAADYSYYPGLRVKCTARCCPTTQQNVRCCAWGIPCSLLRSPCCTDPTQATCGIHHVESAASTWHHRLYRSNRSGMYLPSYSQIVNGICDLSDL